MKRLLMVIFALAVVAFVAWGVTGNGGRDGSTVVVPDSIVAVGATTRVVADEMPELVRETEPVGYPGTNEKTYLKTSKVEDGFELRMAVQVWEPVRFDAEYPHPAYPGHVMTNPEGMVEDSCWVIPFKVTLENMTQGFGAAEPNVCIGLNSDGIMDYAPGVFYDIERGVGQVYAREKHWVTYDYLAESRYARVLCMAWYGSGNLSRSGEYALVGSTVNEGVNNNWYGYFIVIDSQRTPDMPNGADLYSSLFVGISSTPTYYDVENVAMLKKNEHGELVFAN